MTTSKGLSLATVFALLLISTTACAGPDTESADIARIAEAFPEIDQDEIRISPIPGLYEISIGNHMAYISADAKYLIQGDLFDVATETNLTEARRMNARLERLAKVDEDTMIIFPAAHPEHTVTVFTDIDCGYCRKLHRQIADYNDEGITVRYMSFPRSGPDTASWFKAENVWCASDRNAALTLAKSGGVVESSADCASDPVAEQYALGRSFGIQGTPAIIADTGELIPGYVSPKELEQYLKEE